MVTTFDIVLGIGFYGALAWWVIAKLVKRHRRGLPLLDVRRRVSAIATRAGRDDGRFSLTWAVGFYLGSCIFPGPLVTRSWWFFLVWFFMWWGVSLVFALSGLRRGDRTNRVYAGLSVAAFLGFACLLLRWPPAIQPWIR